MNAPFCIINTNVVDETQQQTVPGNIGGQAVCISQEQQRKVSDTLKTYVTPNPFQQAAPSCTQYTQSSYYNDASNVCPGAFPVRADKYAVPGGVAFSFKPHQQLQQQQYNQLLHQSCPVFSAVAQQHQQCPGQSMIWQPTSLQPDIMMNELQKHGAETLKFQQYNRNQPFQLQFHQNRGTVTSGLCSCSCAPASGGLPDLSNVAAATKNDFQVADPIPLSEKTYPEFPLPCPQLGPNAKKLTVKPLADNSHQSMNIFEDLAKDESSPYPTSCLNKENNNICCNSNASEIKENNAEEPCHKRVSFASPENEKPPDEAKPNESTPNESTPNEVTQNEANEANEATNSLQDSKTQTQDSKEVQANMGPSCKCKRSNICKKSPQRRRRKNSLDLCSQFHDDEGTEDSDAEANETTETDD